jgi:hypothetical protein
MTIKNIEIIPVEQSSSEVPSHADAKIKSKSISNVHNLESHSVGMKNSSITRKHRKAHTILITYNVSTTHKIRIAEYTICLLFLL